MSLSNRKILWLLVWILLIVSGPLTVVLNSDLSRVTRNEVTIINFFQRITGLLAFTLISIQIVIGHFMNKWTQLVGSRAYSLHITQGLFAYLFVFLHPSLALLMTYNLSRSFAKTFSFLIPRLNSQSEIYLTYGKISLVLVTFAVVTAYFRTNPFFRKHWLKLHVLNYFIFYAIFYHMRIGSDITSLPFVWVSWAALVLVTASGVKRFILPVFSIIKAQKADEMTKQKA